jgi:hypothetical protein
LNYVGTFKDIQFIPLYYFRRDDVVNRKVWIINLTSAEYVPPFWRIKHFAFWVLS